MLTKSFASNRFRTLSKKKGVYGVASQFGTLSIIEMGGAGAETQDTRATEASVRGFWKAYRTHMTL